MDFLRTLGPSVKFGTLEALLVKIEEKTYFQLVKEKKPDYQLIIMKQSNFQLVMKKKPNF